MKNKVLLLAALTITGLAVGCSKSKMPREIQNPVNQESSTPTTEPAVIMPDEKSGTAITPGTEIMELEDGLSAVRYDGDYWFDDFLSQGGALSDAGVIAFLNGRMQLGAASPIFQINGFGCSTLAVSSPEGEVLFGRNFDWQNCEALIVRSNPSDGEESPPHGHSAESFESTEWSIVFNLNTGEARYYHREDYGNGYRFHVNQ